MKATTVDEYINNLEGEKRQKMSELREIIKAILPDTQEVLKWGAPAFVEKDGMILVVYSAFKDHMNFVVTPSAQQSAGDELSGYVTGKGSTQLRYDKPLPTELIEKMTTFRAKEYRENGVKWK